MGLFEADEPIPLPQRFADIKNKIITGNEEALTQSWHRLLEALRVETAAIETAGPSIIPELDFANITNPTHAEAFITHLKARGVGIVRGVVSREQALEWKHEATVYLASNPQTRGHPSHDPQLFEIFWSPAQVAARAHPNVLATQKFAMHAWDIPPPHSSTPPSPSSSPVASSFSSTTSTAPEPITITRIPITYADRLRIQKPGDVSTSLYAQVDNGSVERWESPGYGRAGTYRSILSGNWEAHSPWDASLRAGASPDLYGGAGSCSIFRMFQGSLSISDVAPGTGALRFCPMLKLTTAYLLLRPFFVPLRPRSAFNSTVEFLSSANWALAAPQTSILHGALPSYTQELTPAMHPHLSLPTTLLAPPGGAEPGDYILWHPDTVYAVSGYTCGDGADASRLYMPVTPLTSAPGTALFLARQRRAFLLGRPPPDFQAGRGEETHVGRGGREDVERLGLDGARGMGLVKWDEGSVDGVEERRVARGCNEVLFPDG